MTNQFGYPFDVKGSKKSVYHTIIHPQGHLIFLSLSTHKLSLKTITFLFSNPKLAHEHRTLSALKNLCCFQSHKMQTGIPISHQWTTTFSIPISTAESYLHISLTPVPLCVSFTQKITRQRTLQHCISSKPNSVRCD